MVAPNARRGAQRRGLRSTSARRRRKVEEEGGGGVKGGEG